MIEYWEIFLNKIKLLLLYLIKFLKNSIMVSKKYLSDCIIEGLEKRLVIMISHNKNIFSVNNR